MMGCIGQMAAMLLFTGSGTMLLAAATNDARPGLPNASFVSPPFFLVVTDVVVDKLKRTISENKGNATEVLFDNVIDDDDPGTVDAESVSYPTVYIENLTRANSSEDVKTLEAAENVTGLINYNRYVTSTASGDDDSNIVIARNVTDSKVYAKNVTGPSFDEDITSTMIFENVTMYSGNITHTTSADDVSSTKADVTVTRTSFADDATSTMLAEHVTRYFSNFTPTQFADDISSTEASIMVTHTDFVDDVTSTVQAENVTPYSGNVIRTESVADVQRTLLAINVTLTNFVDDVTSTMHAENVSPYSGNVTRTESVRDVSITEAAISVTHTNITDDVISTMLSENLPQYSANFTQTDSADDIASTMVSKYVTGPPLRAGNITRFLFPDGDRSIEAGNNVTGNVSYGDAILYWNRPNASRTARPKIHQLDDRKVDKKTLGDKWAACFVAANMLKPAISFTCNTILLMHYSFMEFWTKHSAVKMCEHREAYGALMECVLEASKGCLPPENLVHVPDNGKARIGLNYICDVGMAERFNVNITCAQSHFREVFECIFRDVQLVTGREFLPVPIWPRLMCRTYDIADLCSWENLQVCGRQTAAAVTRLMSLYLRPPSCNSSALRLKSNDSMAFLVFPVLVLIHISSCAYSYR